MTNYTVEQTGTTEYYAIEGDGESYFVVRRYDANSDSSDWEVYDESAATEVSVPKRDELIQAVLGFTEQE